MNEKPEDPSKKHLRVEHLSPEPVIPRKEGVEDIPDLTIDELMKMTDVPDEQKLEILYGALNEAKETDSKKELLGNIIKLEKDEVKSRQMEFLLRQLLLS